MLLDLRKLIDRYSLSIRGIIHVGAHTGEEMGLYRDLGIENIIWIEANPYLAVKVRRKILRMGLEKTNFIFSEVISDKDGDEVEFKIMNNTATSSMLELGLNEERKNLKVDQKIKLSTTTLDTVIKGCGLDMNDYNMLNLDIQGVELRALKGMSKNLKHIDYVYTEINRVQNYKGCDQEKDLTEFLNTFGFKKVEERWLKHGWGDALYKKN